MNAVSSDELRAIVHRLAGETSRNTNVSEIVLHEDVLGRLRKVGLQPVIHEYDLPVGPRVPVARRVAQVYAFPVGDGPLMMIGAHIDSLNLQGLDQPAPGANDNASGVALVLECARILRATVGPAGHRIGFALFTGEEQGLVGSRALARHAHEQGWPLVGMFGVDMVGNSTRLTGHSNPKELRAFSEAGASRELARAFELSARPRIKLVLRGDRHGRGGDHTPFQREGFPAIRLTDAVEEYARQHTPEDTPEGIDWEYLAANTQSVVDFLRAWRDSTAAATDATVRRDGEDTTVSWSGATEVEILWRDTRDPHWRYSMRATGASARLAGVELDDHEFGVRVPGGLPLTPKVT